MSRAPLMFICCQISTRTRGPGGDGPRRRLPAPAARPAEQQQPPALPRGAGAAEQWTCPSREVFTDGDGTGRDLDKLAGVASTRPAPAVRPPPRYPATPRVAARPAQGPRCTHLLYDMVARREEARPPATDSTPSESPHRHRKKKKIKKKVRRGKGASRSGSGQGAAGGVGGGGCSGGRRRGARRSARRCWTDSSHHGRLGGWVFPRVTPSPAGGGERGVDPAPAAVGGAR